MGTHLIIALAAAVTAAVPSAVNPDPSGPARDYIFPERASDGFRDVRSFGAVPEDLRSQAAAFQAAIDSLKGRPGIVYVPEGTWNLGPSGSPGEGISIKSSGVRLLGAGMGRTVLTYQSHVAIGPGGNRAAIEVGERIFPYHKLHDASFSDFTIRDLNAALKSSGSIGAISTIAVQYPTFERVEFSDCKGATCLTAEGMWVKIGDVLYPQVDQTVVVRDCWFHGTVDGARSPRNAEAVGNASIEGDGFNGVWYDWTILEGNRFEGIGRGGAEGNFGSHLVARGNIFRECCYGITNIATRDAVIEGNEFVDFHPLANGWNSQSSALLFTDEGTHGIDVGNVAVSSNVFKSSHGSFVVWQYDSHPHPNTMGHVAIIGNVLRRSDVGANVGRWLFWIGGPVPSHLVIASNTIETGPHGAVLGGYPGQIREADVVLVYGNAIDGTGWQSAWERAMAASPGLRFWGNAMSPPSASRIAGFRLEAAVRVPPYGRSRVFITRADVLQGGLRIGDQILGKLPDAMTTGGIRLVAWVPETDTIKFYFENISDEPVVVPGGGASVSFAQERRGNGTEAR